MPGGILYIIATPIGNLSDITLRALETLKSVSLILSEDTRETSKILDKYQINKPQISYRDQNHNKVYSNILDLLNNGQAIALMSDCGTPLISDPGYKLVSQLIKDGIKIESIPGPSAVISALVVSGLPTDKFCFLGFLPKSSNQRKNILLKYGNLDATLIIYESPFRVSKLIEEISEILGNRKICLASELTKKYEKLLYGNTADIIQSLKNFKPKGEYVVLIGKSDFNMEL